VQGILDLGLKIAYEIIVVDNGSRDGSSKLLQAKFQQVKFIGLPKNFGMGTGNNVGIKQAYGSYVLILNPDVVVLPGAIETLVEFMEKKESVGCAVPMLLNPDKSYQRSRYLFPPFFMPLYLRTSLVMKRASKLSHYFMEDVPYDKPHQVDWGRGSALLLRKSVLDKVGGFDENFFMYMEDADLCRQIWQQGSQVWYVPASRMVHYYGRGSGEVGSWRWLRDIFKPLAWHHIVSWFRFCWKWRKTKTSFV
jgi:GT2 family glycosyltransferase